MNALDKAGLGRGEPAKARSTFALVVLCTLAVLGIVALVRTGDPSALLTRISLAQAQVHATIAHWGPWAVVGFIVAYGAAMLLISVPSWPWSMLGGFLFGTLAGGSFSLVGSTLGAIGVFELTRAGLAHRIPRTNPLLRKLDAGFRRNALEYVIALRVMPIMPFGIIHVASALLSVSRGTFILGTIIGMIPCVFIYAFLGEQLAQIAARGQVPHVADLFTTKVYVALALLALLALVPALVRRIIDWRSRNDR